jgi:hypothetical protein
MVCCATATTTGGPGDCPGFVGVGSADAGVAGVAGVVGVVGVAVAISIAIAVATVNGSVIAVIVIIAAAVRTLHRGKQAHQREGGVALHGRAGGLVVIVAAATAAAAAVATAVDGGVDGVGTLGEKDRHALGSRTPRAGSKV